MIPAVGAMLSGGVQPIAILDAWSTISTSIAAPGSVAVSNGSNRLLLARTSSRATSGRVITSLSYGGQAMTLIDEESTTAGPDLHTALWRLNEAGLDAISGTAFVLTSSSAAATEFRMQAASYANVSQGSPIVDSFSLSSPNAGDAPDTEALTTVVDGIALGFLGINQGASTIEPDPDASFANMTEIFEDAASNSHHLIGQADTDGTNFTPSVSTSHLSRAHLIGVALRPA